MSAAAAMPPPPEQATTVGRLMDEIEGDDHRRIARVVDLKVNELRDELKSDISAVGAAIKYSLGELAGKLEAAQAERTDAARTTKEIASKLDQHLGEHAAVEPAKRAWWQDPRWLSAAATLAIALLALGLLLGPTLVERLISHVLGG